MMENCCSDPVALKSVRNGEMGIWDDMSEHVRVQVRH